LCSDKACTFFVIETRDLVVHVTGHPLADRGHLHHPKVLGVFDGKSDVRDAGRL
jgi:hypothetical protein